MEINPTDYTLRGSPIQVLSVKANAKIEVHALAEVITLIRRYNLPTVIKIEHLEDDISAALEKSSIKDEVTCFDATLFCI
jgi:hypothetical protein